MVMDRAWGKPRDGTNGVVLQMGVPLGGWGLTMSEHLADEVEAVAARYGDRGEAVPKVMNATSSSPAVARTRCQGFWMPAKCPSPRSTGRTYGLPSWRGSSASARSAGAPSGTVLAPVLLSGSIRQPRSKSIHSHRSDRISDRRHPVRIRSRIAAMIELAGPPLAEVRIY
jgi:hypothetical protein